MPCCCCCRRRRLPPPPSKQDDGKAKHKQQLRELQSFIKSQIAEKKAHEAAEVRARRARPTTVDLEKKLVLTAGDAGVAEALGTLPPPEEVDPAQLSPKR